MDFKFFTMPFRLFIVSLLLVSTVFFLEMVMPIRALATVGYIIIILYVLRFPQQDKYSIILGIVATFFIVLGYFLTASTFKDQPSVPLNRALSLLAIWLAVYFSNRYKKSLDKEIRQKEQLNAIFNNATEGMLIVNQSGVIVLVNTFTEKLFGYRKDELLGSSIENLLPDRMRFAHHHQRAGFMAHPQTRPMGAGRELLAKRKNGSEFPVEISLSHFKNEEGTFAIAFVLDLTERKKALEALAHEQKLTQTYFELAPVFFVVLDTTGKIISANDYGRHHLGYSKEEVLGKHFTAFIPEDAKEDTVERFSKTLDGTNKELQNESVVRNSRGEEIEMSWRRVAIKDEKGVTVSVLAAGIDITEKKKHERLSILHLKTIQNLNDQLELKIRNRTGELNRTVHSLEKANNELVKSQLLFKTIMHHFPDSVIGVLNKELKYVFVDGQELQSIGLMKDDNRGERLFDNIHPVLAIQSEEKLKKVFTGVRISYDLEMGEKAYVINAAPLPDENGQINEIMVVIKNITERKKTEKELLKSIEKERELSDMKSKFVTMASHEFRTPLTTILSSVFLLENYEQDELEKNKAVHLGKIKRSVNNLTELLNDFISLGKLEEGKIKVNYTSINVRAFLEELVPEMELVRKGNQIIRCEYFGEESDMLLDKSLLRSILLNLIGNAIKYSSMDSAIKLTAHLTENELIIKVIDQGIGIPHEEHKQIFKRYYRASNAANIAGTGLGLNITRKYVRLMKGKIEFQSRPSEGTTFTVTIPILI
jgi:PAS domain S-box-containing protein